MLQVVRLLDVGDLVRTIINDSTVTCRMKRSDVINNAHIQAGDVIVGLSSFGKATYEKEYNGGMGSNGLTSARHDVLEHRLAQRYPESYDVATPEELAGAVRVASRPQSGRDTARSLVNSFYPPHVLMPQSSSTRRTSSKNPWHGTLGSGKTDEGASLR